MLNTEEKINELKHTIVFTNDKLFIPSKFSDGIAVKDWFSHIKLKLAKRNDNASRFVYFILINRRKIMFELKKQELLRYVSYGNFPVANDRNSKFFDGSLMGDWFRRNKTKLVTQAKEGDFEASLLIEIYNKPKFKNLKIRKYLTFDEKVLELYNLLRKGKNVFDRKSRIKFSDGVDIKTWVNAFKKRLILMNSEESEFILCKIPVLLSFEQKLKEFLVYIYENQKFPADERFSDGVLMNDWFYNFKLKIYLMSEYDETARMVVDNILKFKPNYFEKINVEKKLVKEG